MRIVEFFQDSTRQLSCYRLCFMIGVFGLFGLAIAQFFGIGELPTALYAILGTMASAGYVVGKTNDSMYEDIPESIENLNKEESN